MSVRYGEKKFASNVQEKRVAEKIKGRVQIASGALDEKGDVKSDKFLVECKTTGKTSYPLRYTTWNKIREEAYKIGKCPVLHIYVNDGKGFYIQSRTGFVIMRRDDFDYYNVKSGLKLQIIGSRRFNKQITLAEEDTHKAIISPLVTKGEELVVLRDSLFFVIIQEDDCDE